MPTTIENQTEVQSELLDAIYDAEIHITVGLPNTREKKLA
jgi:hypothetical protein